MAGSHTPPPQPRLAMPGRASPGPALPCLAMPCLARPSPNCARRGLTVRLTDRPRPLQNEFVESIGSTKSGPGAGPEAVRLEDVLRGLGIPRRTFEHWRRRGVLPRNLNPTVRRGARSPRSRILPVREAPVEPSSWHARAPNSGTQEVIPHAAQRIPRQEPRPQRGPGASGLRGPGVGGTASPGVRGRVVHRAPPHPPAPGHLRDPEAVHPRPRRGDHPGGPAGAGRPRGRADLRGHRRHGAPRPGPPGPR
jgi:hypothetical protein